eukprot:scaffold11527_cov105-Skeletonema_dohrnii-CCMP3373.AAC.7
MAHNFVKEPFPNHAESFSASLVRQKREGKGAQGKTGCCDGGWATVGKGIGTEAANDDDERGNGNMSPQAR